MPTFTDVLADEYQDLNRADQALIDRLAGAGSVVVVGDPDQSIYRFRHANPEAMAAYADTLPTHTTKSSESVGAAPSVLWELQRRWLRTIRDRFSPFCCR